jgi:hypothetical protein
VRAPAGQRSDDEIIADILQLVGCLDEGEKLVRKLIKDLRADLPPRSLWGVPWVIFEFNPQTRNYIEQEPKRLKRFRADLRHMRFRCNGIVELELGAHGHLNHRHVHAALAARALLWAAAAMSGTKLRLACSPTSKFGRLASLFLEAATGEYDADLQRACEAVQ